MLRVPLMLMLKGGDQIQGKVQAEAFKAVAMRKEIQNQQAEGGEIINDLLSSPLQRHVGCLGRPEIDQTSQLF